MIKIRDAASTDIDSCGRILYDSYHVFAERFHFPEDFTRESASRVASLLIHHAGVYGAVAELDGHVVGSSFLDQRNPIRGVGPVSVDPHYQGRGIGRRLAQAALQHAQGSTGVRLIHDSLNARSLALYALLGFEVKELTVLLSGRPDYHPPSGIQVRPLAAEDVPECEKLCQQVLGFTRTSELHDALKFLTPVVATSSGRVVAYATSLTDWVVSHGVAESEDAMRALVCGAAHSVAGPLHFLLPTRHHKIFAWFLKEGFRVVKPMTLMAIGDYQEPQGCFFPSSWY
mgnify:CR=1 FL=1